MDEIKITSPCLKQWQAEIKEALRLLSEARNKEMAGIPSEAEEYRLKAEAIFDRLEAMK